MRVVLAGGGTAGHIEPALALADALRQADPRALIICLGTERGLETRLVPMRGYELALIPAVPLPRSVTPRMLAVPGKMAGAVNAACNTAYQGFPVPLLLVHSAVQRLSAITPAGQGLGELVDLVTMDASFISLTMLLPRIPAVLKPGGHCVALVKPQFEVGREHVGKGGIVRDPELQRSAIEKVAAAGRSAGLVFVASEESPITGREGNREFFALFRKESS